MVAAAVVWIGLFIAIALRVGVAFGRSWERHDRLEAERELDEAEEEVARLHVLDRVDWRPSVPAKW